MIGSLTIWENLGYKFGPTTSSVVCSVNIVYSERYDVVEFEAHWNGGAFHSFCKTVIQVWLSDYESPPFLLAAVVILELFSIMQV